MDTLLHAHVDGSAQTIIQLSRKLRETGLITAVDLVKEHCAGPQSEDPSYRATYTMHNPKRFDAFTTTPIEGRDDLQILAILVRAIKDVVLEVEQVIGEYIPKQGFVWHREGRLELPQVSVPPSSTKPIEVHFRLEAKNPSPIILQEMIDRAHAAGIDFGGLFVLDNGRPKRVVWSNAFYDEEGIRELVEDQRRRLEEVFRDFTITLLVERVLEIVRS